MNDYFIFSLNNIYIYDDMTIVISSVYDLLQFPNTTCSLRKRCDMLLLTELDIFDARVKKYHNVFIMISMQYVSL